MIMMLIDIKSLVVYHVNNMTPYEGRRRAMTYTKYITFQNSSHAMQGRKKLRKLSARRITPETTKEVTDTKPGLKFRPLLRPIETLTSRNQSCEAAFPQTQLIEHLAVLVDSVCLYLWTFGCKLKEIATRQSPMMRAAYQSNTSPSPLGKFIKS